ncbi:hypothetical protein GCM10022254_47450 [Actinomadura meridiana]|uniref:Adenosine deaminase n=1 Tax=Actinomadura meridiana TaxID=559626 RepID=A0ABP8CAY8_9ACTN
MRERRFNIHLHLDGTVLVAVATAVALSHHGEIIEHAEALLAAASLTVGLLSRPDADL